MNYKEKARNVVMQFMEDNQLTYAKIASQFHKKGSSITRQSFWKMVSNGSIKLSTFLEILDMNKSQMKIETINGDLKSGYGERVVQEIDGVVYDTWKCSSLSSTFYSDGKNKYKDHIATELYVELESDKTILAHYCDDEYRGTEDGKKFPWLEIVDSEFRARYIGENGVQ